MIRVFVTDDHELLREGIKKVLKEELDIRVTGEARTAAETLGKIQPDLFDVVILDLSLPDRNGLDIIRELKQIDNKAAILILSMYPEDQFAVRSIKAGASAYLSKNISSKELSEAIRIILKGERYLTSSLAELITNELRQDSNKNTHDALSDREYQVFLLIASGKNVTTIAGELSLSVKTISVYRANILKKMNLKNNAEITYYAFKNDLVG